MFTQSELQTIESKINSNKFISVQTFVAYLNNVPTDFTVEEINAIISVVTQDAWVERENQWGDVVRVTNLELISKYAARKGIYLAR